MSSTNRSNARGKHIADYYVTPVNKIVEFLKAFEEYDDVFATSNLTILDPCAGGDNKHAMSYPTALQSTYPTQNHKIITLDIREDSLAETVDDYMGYAPLTAPDIIITNPPFNLALPIIKKALTDVKNDGYVIMLLRLNFFGSKNRFPFFEENMPKYTYVHHRRISFTNGATDSIEYMHAVWQTGYTGKFTKLRII